jgi:hypothetical protein
MARHSAAALALSVFAIGCGSTAEGPHARVSSETRAERYFPLIDGCVHLYETLTNETGEEGLLVARVHRASEREGELRFPSRSAGK